MKVTLMILFFFVATIAIRAQIVNPEIVVTEMPVITMAVCKTEAREQFLKQVYHIKTEVEEEITRRKAEAKRNNKGFNEQASKNMSNQAGIPVSDADMQKMKNASKEEKQAMAMAMMQQNMNMSAEEAKKANKMSPETQKAWGEAMSTEMMAEAQANPEKSKAAQKSNMGRYEMVEEQSELAQKIQLSSQKFAEQLEEFNKLKEKTLNEFEACLKKVDKDYENKINFDLGDSYAEAIESQKNTCYQTCCGFLTPKYKSILLDRFDTMIALKDDYNRMDVLTIELDGATTGANKNVIEPGLTYLEALLDYILHLQDLPAPYFQTK